MVSSGPTVRRRQLGVELRRLRDAAGMRIEDVAPILETSTARLSRIETGQGNATPKALEVRKLCELYGVDNPAQVEALLQLLRESQQQGWWTPYEAVMPSRLDILVGLENDARRAQVFEPLLIPGLLQIPDYARALMLAGRARLTENVDQLVQLRMERQQLLARDPDPLLLWAVLDEAALRRTVGGPETMRAQLRHVIAAAETGSVKVQILPFSKGAHEGLDGPFTLLEFNDAPTVVYVESQAGNVYIEKDRDIHWYTEAFGVLCANALDFEQSTAFLQRVVKEI